MKKILCIFFIIIPMLLSACAKSETPESAVSSTAITAEMTESAQPAENETKTEAEEMNDITLIINETEFGVTLYDNETARELKKRLPLTVNMEELHGNEKYYYLDSSLPSSPTVPSGIRSGDIKLFGSDCLVVFYEDFNTSYSYTDIGKINNPDGLKEALGDGNITVTFR